MCFLVDQSRAKWMDQQWGYRTWFWGLHGYRCGVPIKVPRNFPDATNRWGGAPLLSNSWHEILAVQVGGLKYFSCLKPQPGEMILVWLILFGLKPPSTFWVGEKSLLLFTVTGRTSQTIPCEANTWLASSFRCTMFNILFTRSPCKSRLKMIQGIYFMEFWCLNVW